MGRAGQWGKEQSGGSAKIDAGINIILHLHNPTLIYFFFFFLMIKDPSWDLLDPLQHHNYFKAPIFIPFAIWKGSPHDLYNQILLVMFAYSESVCFEEVIGVDVMHNYVASSSSSSSSLIYSSPDHAPIVPVKEPQCL